VGALVLMLAVPVATFFFLADSGATASAKSSLIGETHVTVSGNVVGPSSGFSRLSPSLDTLPWLVEAWLLGVAFFSLRSAGGFLILERERRKQSDTVSARVLDMCQALQRQLGLNRTIRYCECLWLQAPAVIGWFRPIVLLPVTALTGLSEEQLQLVIVHEKTIEKPYGWIFSYTSKRWRETGEIRFAVAGNAPFLVARDTGGPGIWDRTVHRSVH